MKIVKTASNIEIKMSQKEWNEIGIKAGWLKTAQNYDFTAGDARAKAMHNTELEFAIEDLRKVIEVQENAAKQGGNVPKLGYYWDELHTYVKELKSRQNMKNPNWNPNCPACGMPHGLEEDTADANCPHCQAWLTTRQKNGPLVLARPPKEQGGSTPAEDAVDRKIDEHFDEKMLRGY